MSKRTQLAGDLLLAQRLLAMIGAGVYRGNATKEAAIAHKAVESAVPLAEPARLRGQLEGVRLVLHVLCVGGKVTKAQCKESVYVLHQFLHEQFPTARMDPEELVAA